MADNENLWDYDAATPANNDNIGGNDIAELNLPSTINNALRELTAQTKAYLLDMAGKNTVGGTGDAITITTNQTFTAYADGQEFSFIASADNTGAATINVDGIGAKAVEKINDGGIEALDAKDVLSGGLYAVRYQSSSDKFILRNPEGLADGTVGTDALANNSVTNAKLAADSVTSDKKTAATIAKDEGFKTVALLIADTDLTYTASQVGTVVAGEFVYAQGYRYEVAASGASDEHVTTAGGVKLYLSPVNGILDFRAAGPNYDGSTSDAALLQTIADFAKSDAETSRLIVDGNIYLPKGGTTVQSYATGKSDPTFDILTYYAVLLDGADNLTIDMTGADVVTDSGAPIVLYNCTNCEIIGGSFTATASTATIASDQASAIIITRSVNCWGRYNKVDGYYRNLWAYRAPECGFEHFNSQNASYYNCYGASELDITIAEAPDETWHYFRFGYAKGGRYGNFFTDNTIAESNESYDVSPSSNSSRHFGFELGNVVWRGNKAYETAAQNSGDLITMFAAVPSSIATDNVNNVHILGNQSVGGYQAFKLRGLTNFSLIGNSCKDYYQTGICLVTETIGSDDWSLQEGVVMGNVIRNMNDSSTRTSTGNDKNAGLQIERNNALDFEDVHVAGNVVDATGTNATKTPTYNVYVEANQGGVTGLGDNHLRLDLAHLIPSWAFTKPRTVSFDTLTSSGSAASPTALDAEDAYDGQWQIFNTHVALPAAKAGMRIFFGSNSSTNYIYVDGASNAATGSDTMYIPGGSSTSTQRNIQFSGPGNVELHCMLDGQWHVSESAGTTLTVTT